MGQLLTSSTITTTIGTSSNIFNSHGKKDHILLQWCEGLHSTPTAMLLHLLHKLQRLAPSFNDSKAGGRVDWPCNEPAAMWILRICDLRGHWMLCDIFHCPNFSVKYMLGYKNCIHTRLITYVLIAFNTLKFKEQVLRKTPTCKTKFCLGCLPKLCLVNFGHHRAYRRLTNRTKPLNKWW